MEQAKNKFRIMAFGIESEGYKVPKEPIEDEKYILFFCPINTSDDFSSFDIVIFFDKTFETISDEIACNNKAEMLKRVKQAFSLLDKGGFICSLIYSIKDEYVKGFRGSTYESNDTSLIKNILNDFGIYPNSRKPAGNPFKHFKIYRNEYLKYLDKYGVTETVFVLSSYEFKNVKPICKVRDVYVGAIIYDKLILLPCLAPDKDEKSTIDLFKVIAAAVTETIQKIRVEIPKWLNEQVLFPEEKKLIENLNRQHEIVKDLELKIKAYEDIKGCLYFSGHTLVEKVSLALEKFFNVKTEKEKVDAYIDDLKLFIPGSESSHVPFAIAEVKGVNSGVKRENINQADSHRERLGLSHDFPTLLIVNVKMDATDLKEKDHEVASDQIKKAVSDKILIIRTLDLLNLIYLMENSKVSRDSVIEIFKNKKGWLKATTEELFILSE